MRILDSVLLIFLSDFLAAFVDFFASVLGSKHFQKRNVSSAAQDMTDVLHGDIHIDSTRLV